MHLYLVQHGDALSKDEDVNRPLSEKGRKEINRLASFLARSRMPVTRFLHSGRLRAQQTALIYANVLGGGRVVQDSPWPIAPDDPIAPLVDALAGTLLTDEGLMIVGHLPYLDRLVSALLGSTETHPCILFETGSVVALTGDPARSDWRLDWFMKPKLLGN